MRIMLTSFGGKKKRRMVTTLDKPKPERHLNDLKRGYRMVRYPVKFK